MIERVLEQERTLVPTWQDIETPSRFTLSGEEYVTLSYIRPVLHLVNNSLLAPEAGDAELCNSIKSCIVDYLNTKYADPSTSDLLDIASLLDPRFKARYISGEKLDALKHKVITEAESLPSDQARCLSELPDPPVTEPADRGEAAIAVPPTAKKKKSLASFFEHSTPTTSTTRTQKDAVAMSF